MQRIVRYVCPQCQTVDKPYCGHKLIEITAKWRAPKKSNTSAWNLIAQGDIWWDKKAVAKKERRNICSCFICRLSRKS